MKRFDLVAQPSPSQDDRIYGKRKYCFSPDAANSSTSTLAGNLAISGTVNLPHNTHVVEVDAQTPRSPVLGSFTLLVCRQTGEPASRGHFCECTRSGCAPTATIFYSP